MLPSQGTAKTTQPHVTNAIPRERLVQRIEAALGQGVIWVLGPPGAGKTVLVASWLTSQGKPALWVNLDEDDCDEASFFHFLHLAAICHVKTADIPTYSPQRVVAPGGFSRAFFRSLFSTPKVPSVLVLDNYHGIRRDSKVHASLVEGIEQCPAGVSVIVLSREEPPGDFTTLRLRKRLVVIEPDELQLTASECAAIAELRTGRNDKTLFRSLHERSRGWVAGLILLLESGTIPKLDAVDHFVFDYFASEVLRAADPDTLAVLLATSVLRDIDVQAAVSLSGVAHAGRILSQLARRGYFTVQLDNPRPTYRFHDLFRQFLRNQFAGRSDTQHRDVCVRASRIFAEAGQLEEAFELAASARAWDDAAGFLVRLAPSLVNEGRVQMLIRMSESLPAYLRDDTPWHMYWYGAACRPLDPASALRSLAQAYEAFEKTQDVLGMVCAWSAAVQSYVWAFYPVPALWLERIPTVEQGVAICDNFQVSCLFAEAVVAALHHFAPQHEALPRWEEYALAKALSTDNPDLAFPLGRQLLFNYGWWGTDLPRAQLISNAFEAVPKHRRIDPANAVMWLMSNTYLRLFLHEPQAAEATALEGLEIAKESGFHFWDVPLYGALVFAALLRDDQTTANANNQLMRAASAATNAPSLVRALRHYVCAVDAIRQRSFSRAIEESRTAARLCDEACIALGQANARVVWAFAAQGSDQGPSLVEALQMSIDARYRPGEFACLVGLAAQSLRTGSMGEAATYLEQAFVFGRRFDILTILWFRRQDWSELCTLALELDIEPEYTKRLIEKLEVPPADGARDLEAWPWLVRVYSLQGLSIQSRRPEPRPRKAPKKLLELLQFLVDAGPHGSSEDHIVSELWPDTDGDRAFQAFHTAVHRLRALLGSSETIRHQDGRFSLNATRVFVDCWALEHLLCKVERLPAASPDAQSLDVRQNLRRRIFALCNPLASDSQAVGARHARLRQRVLRLNEQQAVSTV